MQSVSLHPGLWQRHLLCCVGGNDPMLLPGQGELNSMPQKKDDFPPWPVFILFYTLPPLTVSVTGFL